MGALISRFVGDTNSVEQQRQSNANSASSEIGSDKLNQRSTVTRQSREPQRHQEIRSGASPADNATTPKIYKTTLEANIKCVTPVLETKQVDATYKELESPPTKPLISERLSEIEEAVIKIQSLIRGYLVRKRLKELEEIKSTVSAIVPPPASFNDAVSDSNLNAESQEEAVSKYIKLVNETNEEFQQSHRTEFYSPSEEEIEATKRKLGEEEAAVKIQSAFRGHLCRKQVTKEKEKDTFFDANNTSGISQDVLIQNALNIASDKVTDSNNELSTPPKEVRGLTESETKCEDLIVFTDEQQSEPVRIIVENSPLDQRSEDKAAVKIQAAYRGYKVRKSISRETSPIRHKTEVSFIPEENQPPMPSSLILSPEVIPTPESESINVLDELESELVQHLLKTDCDTLEDNSLDQADDIFLTHNIHFQSPEINDTIDENTQQFTPEQTAPEVSLKPETAHAQETNSNSVAFCESSSTLEGNLEEFKPNIHFEAQILNEDNKGEQIEPKTEFVPIDLNEALIEDSSDESINLLTDEITDELEATLQFQSPKSNENKDDETNKIKTTNKDFETLLEPDTSHASHKSISDETGDALMKRFEELKLQFQFQCPKQDEETIKQSTGNDALNSASEIETKAASVFTVSETSAMNQNIEFQQTPIVETKSKEIKDNEDKEQQTSTKRSEKDEDCEAEEDKCQNRNKNEIESDIFELKPKASATDEAIVSQITGITSVLKNDDNSTNHVEKEINLQAEIDMCESLPKVKETNQTETSMRSIEAKSSEELSNQNCELDNEEVVTEIGTVIELKCESHESLNQPEFQNRNETVIAGCSFECTKSEYTAAVDTPKEADAEAIDEQIKTNIVVSEMANKLDVVSDIKANLSDIFSDVPTIESDPNETQISQPISFDLYGDDGNNKNEKFSISIIEAPPDSLLSESVEDDCHLQSNVASGSSNPAHLTPETSGAVDNYSEVQSLGNRQREIRSKSPNPFGRRRKRGKKGHQQNQ